jgi:LuxR family glucitol operon transcriptional activator
MFKSAKFEMPEEFPDEVHEALKAWHRSRGGGELERLLLARHSPEATGTAGSRSITNQILLNGLDALRTVDPDASDLLRWRFLDGETARAVGNRLNVSEDAIYQRQRVAIERLGKLIWEEELKLRLRRGRRIEGQLGGANYTKLFGVEERMAELRGQLESGEAPWILSVEGMGGIGKTALVDALVRQFAYELHFREINWISVRQRLFRPSRGVESLPAPPLLTPDALVDRLVADFGLSSLRHLPVQEKVLGLREYLEAERSLVVIDNLETLEDYWALVPRLRQLAGPSKFLITSRHSLQGAGSVYILGLTGLGEKDTLALLRYEAHHQGLQELAALSDARLRPIYEATGGNPLAVKLVVGQIHTFELSSVLERLDEVTGGPVEELVTYIHVESWKRLRPECRLVLRSLLLAPDAGARQGQVVKISGLDEERAITCLRDLVTFSLVTVIGGVEEKRYSLHPLTRAFVSRQPPGEA